MIFVTDSSVEYVIFCLVIISSWIISKYWNGSIRSRLTGHERRTIWNDHNHSVEIGSKQFLTGKARYESGFMPENIRGNKVFYFKYTPTEVEPRGIFCFCHGYNDHCSWMHSNLISLIVNAGYIYLAFDQEGCGQSDGLQSYITHHDHMVDTAMSVFDTHLAEYDANLPRFLCGQSMGGAVAIKLHLSRPNYYWNGVVLFAPMAKIMDHMRPPYFVEYILRKVEPLFPTLPIVPTSSLTDSAFKLQESRDLVRANPIAVQIKSHRLRTALQLLEMSTEIASRLVEFKSPLLILHGKADVVTDPMVSHALYEISSSNDKTIKLYEDGWHALMHESEDIVSEVKKDVIQWLNARS